MAASHAEERRVQCIPEAPDLRPYMNPKGEWIDGEAPTYSNFELELESAASNAEEALNPCRAMAHFVYFLKNGTSTQQEIASTEKYYLEFRAAGLPAVKQFRDAMHHYRTTARMPIDSNKDAEPLCCGHTGSSVIRNQLGKICTCLLISELVCKKRLDEMHDFVEAARGRNMNIPGMGDYFDGLKAKVAEQQDLVRTIATDVVELYRSGTVTNTYKIAPAKKTTNRWNSFTALQYALCEGRCPSYSFVDLFLFTYEYSKGIHWAQEVTQHRASYVEAKKREESYAGTLESDLSLAQYWVATRKAVRGVHRAFTSGVAEYESAHPDIKSRMTNVCSARVLFELQAPVPPPSLTLAAPVPALAGQGGGVPLAAVQEEARVGCMPTAGTGHKRRLVGSRSPSPNMEW